MPIETTGERDSHSYSNPQQTRIRHVDLDWDVLFDRKILDGSATFTLENASSQTLVLDTRNLSIKKAETSSDSKTFQEAKFELGKADPIVGAPLTIHLPAKATQVRVRYSTSPDASGLQWLDPAQTAGKKYPFLFTQSEAIHARSWIPLQDTPGVRITYTARVRTPPNLLALMSAENDSNKQNGAYEFRMPQPIPSYLIALAVGDLAFRAVGERSGVYAERPVIERAAREFADTEKMMQAAEELYGPYRWGRYDVLVLPPSFPFGGMENPRLTFATPTVLAGDKSLVALVAHELAHSWSGNLVTNATWSDFWLNEGFTVYIERRIVEKVYGARRAEMEAVLGRQELDKELARLDDRDEMLHVDLKGRDPDAGFTDIPYEKGGLFLKTLEQAFGREKFDAFLRGYFNHFAFQSITTAEFIEYLKKNLLNQNSEAASRIPLEEWIYKPGVPKGAAEASSDTFAKVALQASEWLQGKIPVKGIQTAGWTTQEWLHFLRYFPEHLGAQKMKELDRAFGFTRTGNSEVLNQWLLMAIRNHYQPAYPRLEQFLTSMGRRKYLKPLYEELAKTPEGRKRALAIYARARATYHPISQATIDEILKSGNLY